MKHVPKRKQRIEPAIVIGTDSETLQGPPITFQFHSPEAPRINGCVFIGKRSAVSVFLAQLGKLKAGNYRMYGHNLEFDMLSFLWEVRAKIRDGNIDLRIGDWTITGRYSKPIFAVFTDGKRRVEVIDSFLWFMTSLEKAATNVCPDLPKLQRPAGLGTTLYHKSDIVFTEYAMRDAVVAYHLGNAIERFHAELQVSPQISLASMGAAVFRQHYMRADIYQPPLYEWMVGAAASYHGGVNRVRPGSEMTWHQNVTALDVSSAYPSAWTRLPSFEDANGYKAYKAVLPRSVPEIGVYQITGKASKCDWPALFDHDFKPLQGSFRDTWVSGFELNEAISTGEVKLSKVKGFYYESKGHSYSPFKAYAEFFYEAKSTEKDKVLSWMHKITLNAPTGKLIQTSPDFTLVDGQLVKIRRAGGLYHPFAASLTTGHTRSVMHPLEHQYNAIHTATDGVFVPGYHEGAKQKTLGAIVCEGHGDLALLRNKLYILYSDTPSDSSFPSTAFDGRHILKCARHGFQGTVGALEAMLVSGVREYKVNKPIKLKTAIKGGEVPNKFITTSRKLNIGVDFKVVAYGKKGVPVGRRSAKAQHAEATTGKRTTSL